MSIGLEKKAKIFLYLKWQYRVGRQELTSLSKRQRIDDIGASKKDVSRVFNAETFIVGLSAGLIGIGATLLLNIPINIIVHDLTGIYALNASLPAVGAVALVIISVLLTYVAGLIPSGIAAKKDPVEALRTE